MSIDLIPLIKIAPIFLVALASPGPDFFLISSLAMKQGRAAGVMGAAGIALGVMIYVLLCVFGLSYVLARMAWLLIAVKVAGGLYLLYLGYMLWKSSLKPAQPDADKAVVVTKKKNPFVMGLMTNVTNPKALAFFTSVFALILNPQTTLATQMAVVCMMGCMTLVWFTFVAFGLSTPHVRKLYMRSAKWIDRAAGTFLALFGVKLLASVRE